MEWSGVEWSGVEWGGLEWSGVEWSGVEWSGVGWSKPTMKTIPGIGGQLSQPLAYTGVGLIVQA